MDKGNKEKQVKTARGKTVRRDLLLAAGALLLAVLIYILYGAFAKQDAVYVVARVDGEEYGRWPLQADVEATIRTAYGENVLVIQNGSASVTLADCPDGLCMHQAPVTEKGGVIICLPHHLSIEAEGNSAPSEEVDTVAK